MPFQTAASAIALPGCPEACGGVQIPYPFGIGPNCSLPGFELSCNTSNNGSLTPFLFNDIPVLNIDLEWGHVRVNKSITSSCYNQETTSGMISNSTTGGWNLSGTPYHIHYEEKFTVVGCDIIANINFDEINLLQSGCSTKPCDIPDNIINGVCSGKGCCQIDIPTRMNYYQVSLHHGNSSKLRIT
ncbi:Wall-associated kinase family protein [Rhynchospora pubera]|uniref:Wall-associated kinase family protein n=1 Tax=Rhynchospora pubera TaxID=906938 RepID=A0AAV8EHB0_9POAL|nr:Wall-associated kinase family protein [Rhynchospora pubera]